MTFTGKLRNWNLLNLVKLFFRNHPVGILFQSRHKITRAIIPKDMPNSSNTRHAKEYPLSFGNLDVSLSHKQVHIPQHRVRISDREPSFFRPSRQLLGVAHGSLPANVLQKRKHRLGSPQASHSASSIASTPCPA